MQSDLMAVCGAGTLVLADSADRPQQARLTTNLSAVLSFLSEVLSKVIRSAQSLATLLKFC